MTILALMDGNLKVRVATQGGTIVDGYFYDQPIFRPYPNAAAGSINPLKCASFPFVPFGNRVEGNSFEFGESRYQLQSNTNWDPLYLHGDGWLSKWDIVEHGDRKVILEFCHNDSNYDYTARQVISLENETLTITLSVRNNGHRSMPFGIGHHLFFPLTSNSKLWAHAQTYWSEKEGFLPDRCLEIPKILNFSSPNTIPREWINNGFDGWDGRASLCWPENKTALHIKCDGVFDRYFVFRSDASFEPNFKADYFCFEPMTHTSNGHNLLDGGGLTNLGTGDELFGSCLFEPEQLRVFT